MKHLARTLLVSVLYFLSAKAVAPLSLVESGSVFALWPPTGVALSALIIFGYRVWPGIFLGALLLNLSLTPLLPSLQIAITNTLGPLLAFWMMQRFGAEKIFDAIRAMAYFILAIFLGSLVTSLGGSLALYLHGFVVQEALLQVWSGWFFGDLIGFMLIVPLAMSLQHGVNGVRGLGSLEGILMLISLLTTVSVIFGPQNLFDAIEFPVVYVLLPVLIWGAVRFQPPVAITMLLIVFLFSTYATILGYGPFIRNEPNDSLFLLQSLNGIFAVTTLFMVAIFREKEVAQFELLLHKEHLEEMIEGRTQELTKANERLRELDRLKSMFIDSMSHELRTPLNAIIGFTNLIVNEKLGPVNAKQKDYLERVYRSSKGLLSIISDVIDISEIEAGIIDLSCDDVDLNELIGESISEINYLSRQKGILVKQEPMETVGIQTDAKRLKQCLINLIGNAIKYSEKGTVTVTAYRHNDHVCIEVADEGIGIAKEEMPHLFQPFHRIDSPLSVQAGGTGLGLYLTRKIVETHLSGSVTVESSVGEGSVFGVCIPLKKAVKSDEAT